TAGRRAPQGLLRAQGNPLPGETLPGPWLPGDLPDIQERGGPASGGRVAVEVVGGGVDPEPGRADGLGRGDEVAHSARAYLVVDLGVQTSHAALAQVARVLPPVPGADPLVQVRVGGQVWVPSDLPGQAERAVALPAVVHGVVAHPGSNGAV